MKGFLIIASVLAFLRIVNSAEAFNDDYVCTAVTETSVGYDPHSNKVQAEAGKVKEPHVVRLTGVIRDRTVLHAQQVAQLAKLSSSGNVIWFAEKAPAGTMILWTLFDRESDRPVTLVSTKSYSLSGAVSFTAFYTCK